MSIQLPSATRATSKQRLFSLDELPPAIAPPQPISLSDFVSMDFPERTNLLSPWLPERGLSMVYAKAGIGKTWFVLGVAVAITNGTNFLSFHADKPRRVLLIDGEMAPNDLQSRLNLLTQLTNSANNFQIVSDGLRDDGIPDLSTVTGQNWIEGCIQDTDLIIFDNISTLFRSGYENEAESWQGIQNWLISLRRRGKSVLIVHHAGHSGNQRGTTKRLDVMDTVIELKHPDNYIASDGLRFEVHFRKARQLTGKDVESFEATCVIHNGSADWTYYPIINPEEEQVRRLRSEGKSYRDIEENTGISRSKAQRFNV